MDSIPCSVSKEHPLKKGVIRIKDGRKVVSVQYVKAGTEFSLISELEPKSLIIPPVPGEGKPLQIRYGATTLEVGEEKRYNLWIFPKSLKHDKGEVFKYK